MKKLIELGLMAHVVSLFIFYNEESSIYIYIIGILTNFLLLLGIMKYQKKLAFTPVVVLHGAFTCLCVISIFYSIEPEESFKRSVVVLFTFINGVCWTSYIDSFDNIKKILRYFVYGGLTLLLFLILTQDISELTDRQRFGAGYINANYLGTMTAISCLFSSYLYLTERNLKWRVFYFVSAFILLGGLGLSGSRNSFLMFMVIIVFAVSNYPSSLKRKLKVVMSVLALVFTLYYFIADSNSVFSETVGNRIDGIINIIMGDGEIDLSVSARLNMISFGLSIFADSILLGYGLDTFAYLYPAKHMYAHNNYIELLVDLGFIGLVVHYALPIVIYVRLRKKLINEPKRIDISMFLSLMAGIFILGIGAVYYYWVQIIDIYVLALAVTKLSHNNSNRYDEVTFDLNNQKRGSHP